MNYAQTFTRYVSGNWGSENTEATREDFLIGKRDNTFDSCCPIYRNARTGKLQGSTAPVASWRNTFSSLAHKEYFFLWVGMLGIMAGMQMQMLARSYLTYDLTGSVILLGVVNAGNALPMLQRVSGLPV